MKKNRKFTLDNLPGEFKTIFMNTTNQINNFGDVIFLAKFSFFVNQIFFQVDFGEKEKNDNAIISRNLIYECFSGDNDFVDNKIKLLGDNQEQYMQSLYAQGLIYLWTSLESLVKRLIETLIIFDMEILTSESFRKVKIPMTDFFQLGEDERAAYLTDLIIDKLDCGHQHGVDKFECYLHAFGLSGTFSSEHKKNILVLHHLRNCIVHNDSNADRRFCKQCGWLKYKVGDKIVVTEDDFRAYEKSVLCYIQEIFYRLNQNLGAPEKYLKLLRNKMNELFGIRSRST